MKTFKLLTTVILLSLVASCKYDDGDVWNELNSLKDRITAIERHLDQINGNISSMQDLVSQLQKRNYVTDVTEIESGYILSFSDGSKTTITNGKDGADAPVINIQFYNGRYYWTQTLNGKTTWLLDDDGNKVPATGHDAITPLLKVDSDGYWLVSYNNGYNYSKVLDEYGEPVKASGKDGNSFFQSVEVNGKELLIVLNDGTEIVLPIGELSPYKAIDLGLSVKWASFNLGATNISEEGELYLWGDPENKGINGSFEAPNLDNICGTRYDIARKMWGGNWRLPSKSEQEELVTRCNWTRKVVNGVSGMRVTGRNGNSIFLPCTGLGFPGSGPVNQDNTQITFSSEGYYWTGTSYMDTYGRFAYMFTFKNDIPYYNASWNTKAARVAVRPVR